MPILVLGRQQQCDTCARNNLASELVVTFRATFSKRHVLALSPFLLLFPLNPQGGCGATHILSIRNQTLLHLRMSTACRARALAAQNDQLILARVPRLMQRCAVERGSCSGSDVTMAAMMQISFFCPSHCGERARSGARKPAAFQFPAIFHPRWRWGLASLCPLD